MKNERDTIMINKLERKILKKVQTCGIVTEQGVAEV
jgi:hypothetical protein